MEEEEEECDGNKYMIYIDTITHIYTNTNTNASMEKGVDGAIKRMQMNNLKYESERRQFIAIAHQVS